ncbi:hypothetical protein GCM10010149_43590 [Nonomuraea roseoviolacea subsp. roseoviolacea]
MNVSYRGLVAVSNIIQRFAPVAAPYAMLVGPYEERRLRPCLRCLYEAATPKRGHRTGGPAGDGSYPIGDDNAVGGVRLGRGSAPAPRHGEGPPIISGSAALQVMSVSPRSWRWAASRR